MIKLSPSILAADFCRLGEQVACVEQAGAEELHIDVMDGMFVPSITIGMPVLASLRPQTGMFFDVHLMIEEPGRYCKEMKEVGTDCMTVHAEACKHLHRTIAQIKEMGMQAGVALNPATPVETLSCILPEVDRVLVMSVNPGFGGQKFLPLAYEKVRRLYELREQFGASYEIEVDGGVTLNNAKQLIDAGAQILVAGTAVFKGDIAGNVKAFKEVFAHVN